MAVSYERVSRSAVGFVRLRVEASSTVDDIVDGLDLGRRRVRPRLFLRGATLAAVDGPINTAHRARA
jgi:hypothetical protein